MNQLVITAAIYMLHLPTDSILVLFSRVYLQNPSSPTTGNLGLLLTIRHLFQLSVDQAGTRDQINSA